MFPLLLRPSETRTSSVFSTFVSFAFKVYNNTGKRSDIVNYFNMVRQTYEDNFIYHIT